VTGVYEEEERAISSSDNNKKTTALKRSAAMFFPLYCTTGSTLHKQILYCGPKLENMGSGK
jgi:hypothetical protein